MKNENLPLYIIAGVIILGLFIVLGVLLTAQIPEANKDIANTVIGALIAGFTAIISYWFGSSKGSNDKNNLFKGNKPE